MSKDKSAEERAAVNRKIARVEQDEDEFVQHWRNYETSLEQFRERFHAVGRERDGLLGQRLQSGDGGAQRELQVRQEFGVLINRYVDGAVDALEETSPRVREIFAGERERLIAERDGLPWE